MLKGRRKDHYKRIQNSINFHQYIVLSKICDDYIDTKVLKEMYNVY